MPPKKNVAPTDAIRRFWCDICSKGYPRQPDYENHLRSYDHNHRQRMADMKKLTAQNEADAVQKRRAGDDMRALPVDGSSKKPSLGPRFTKVGGDKGGARFKKVGTTTKTGEEDATVPIEKKTVSVAELLRQKEELDRQIAAAQAEEEQKSVQVVHEEEEIDWVEVPFVARIRAGGDPWDGVEPELRDEFQELVTQYGLV
ncbi:hypothetical protein B0J11DRAFT_516889 [Dendryphion nanum]|uniref:C2H2-type domain-containing protein n=1 Tax=Dendryphion nanum TaxID=256645 RepID=A0A9P9EL82_9PLEO|nr:hypothetical protein B0J11DRAFT_516889 [Dendryphion nanum]